MSDNKVADRWSDASFTHALSESSWMASLAVLLYLNERATGHPAYDWLSSWSHRFFAGNDLRVLVLGCGEGWLERAVAKWPFVSRIDAVDLAVERARAQAPPNVHYAVADLNRDTLEHDAFDVVVAHMILHHVENLEHALGEIERAMKRDATFIVNEYVGPKRFQFGDEVLDHINRLAACVGVERRERPPLQLMIDLDPSEAVRSDEMMPLIRERFEVLEEKQMGGTILQHLLYGIVQRFPFEHPKKRAMVELMCRYEATLVDRGAIPSDFTICAARKRGSRVTKVNRPMPPRPEAEDIDPDPILWRTGDSPVRTDAGVCPPLDARSTRILLASQQSHRASLFKETRLGNLFARFRTVRLDPNDADDRALLALAHAIHSLG